MMALGEIFTKISAVFTFPTATATGTGTGLDAVGSTPAAARVATELFNEGAVPATTRDIVTAHRTVFGSDADVEDVLEVENFLLSFGWLR